MLGFFLTFAKKYTIINKNNNLQFNIISIFMQVTLLKGKLHSAIVTDANIRYEGSISIDAALIEAAGFFLNERVEIYNVTNGQRFSTYVIEAPKNSEEICLNGAAARLVCKGDEIIICSYCILNSEEAKIWKPKVILLNKKNTLS